MSGKTGWEPATEAEVALYDALIASDQERYFRALGRIELLLPVSADAVAGRMPMGWATWTANDQTHLLAFTSNESMRTCLAEHVGGARRMSLRDLAGVWPNNDWWLAVNPGLPIEGYLPAWFVVQLARGDARLPRQAGSGPRDRLQRVEALERAKQERARAARAATFVHPVPATAPALPPVEAMREQEEAARLEMARAEIVRQEATRAEQARAEEEKARQTRMDDERAREKKPRHAEPEPAFVPANSVEEQLYEAAEAGNTDAFLSTLLLATVLIPKSSGTTNGQWRPQPIDGEPHIVCYTSTQHLADSLETIPIRFIKLISEWPDPNWSFAVNPGTPVGATLPGGQLLALANWAAEVGLGGDDDDREQPATAAQANGSAPTSRTGPEVTVLQKAIAPSQIGYYLDRGYDRVTGFVHRAHELGQLKTPAQMRAALGLDWAGSPFSDSPDEMYLLRWSAYRPSLYRIPYGGQTEAAMRAMEGWVIERAPFRGNGFAPGESKEIIAEFKADSVRLPHGTRLFRLTASKGEELIAILDIDGQRWLRTDGGSSA
ncbi:SseB family protein [Allorhizocola rhizosphaerae]|uniref:SseB family protein n=1 Tax=Allorhizocola rhizosphaerae TaxID=1872709 RepID=UPI000E3D3ACC|nr:SseB family protein [Allorhizocola rhizosphaerae]